jgi:hypothetical protein
MSEVASLSPCRELYELSGWNDTDFIHSETYVNEKFDRYRVVYLPNSPEVYEENGKTFGEVRRHVTPAYSVGYLLRKLPRNIEDSSGNIYRLRGGSNQYFYWQYECVDDPDVLWWNISPFSKDSPEDALCTLAVALFKQDVI